MEKQSRAVLTTTRYFEGMSNATLLNILEALEEDIKPVIKVPFKLTLMPQDTKVCQFNLWSQEELEPKETFKILYELLTEFFSPYYYPVIEYLKQEAIDLTDIGYGPIYLLSINMPLLLDMKDSQEQRRFTEGIIYGNRTTDIEDKILSNLKPFTQA
jgi:hypothetical protein